MVDLQNCQGILSYACTLGTHDLCTRYLGRVNDLRELPRSDRITRAKTATAGAPVLQDAAPGDSPDSPHRTQQTPNSAQYTPPLGPLQAECQDTLWSVSAHTLGCGKPQTSILRLKSVIDRFARQTIAGFK